MQCSCDHSGKVGNNNNGYQCGNTHAFCGHQEQACITKPGNIFSRTPNNSSCSGAAAKNGCPPPTYTDLTGIECQSTAITCKCTNPGIYGNTTITCTNAIQGQQPYVKDCGPGKICAQGPTLSHTVYNQTIQGIDCQETCRCNGTNGAPGTHGKTGNNNNGWTCADGSKSSSCSNREDYCQNNPSSPGGVECVNSTKCTCNSDKTAVDCTSPGSGDGGKDETQTFTCGSGQQCTPGGSMTVFNQTVTGAACQNVVLPPPPSPPCQAWANGECTTFNTGLGAFSTDPAAFIQNIFAILLSISGGIALLLIIRAGYQLMVSQGKPEQIQQGRDQLIAAIVGLVFLIFSFVFLQLIGFDILHIPGFSGTNTGGTCQPGSCIQESLCTTKNPGHCDTNGCPGGQACVQ